jgi:hypothetical protein
MTPLEIVAILVLTTWAIYRQTIVSEVTFTKARFKMAIIYAVVGLVVGGFDTPSSWAGWTMILTGLALSFVVGLIRGRYTKLWIADDTVWRQGTVFTVGLFIGLIAAKFALGTLAYFWHIDDGAGFGEVLVMIAIMIAVQAQIIYVRARPLQPSSTAPSQRVTPTAH